jgi:hypothetical protein
MQVGKPAELSLVEERRGYGVFRKISEEKTSWVICSMKGGLGPVPPSSMIMDYGTVAEAIAALRRWATDRQPKQPTPVEPVDMFAGVKFEPKPKKRRRR